MKEEILLVVLKSLTVGILFAACGAGSSATLLLHFPGNLDLRFAVPFALLSALLFIRTRRAFFAVPLMIAVWAISSPSAYFVGMFTRMSLAPGLIGGFIGALGLVLSVAICYPSLFSVKYFALGASIGTLCGALFEPWVKVYVATDFRMSTNPNVALGQIPVTAFAVWQAALGTYLYALCAYAKKKL